jgi:hypothetical protein
LESGRNEIAKEFRQSRLTFAGRKVIKFQGRDFQVCVETVKRVFKRRKSERPGEQKE